MGEVAAPHDVVLAEDVEQPDADRIALVGGEALSAPVFRRLHGQRQILELILPLKIHVLEDVGDPADAALADHQLQARVGFQHAAVDRLHDDLRHRKLEAGDVHRERLATLQVAHGVVVVVHARADGVVVDGQPGLLRRSP